MIQIVLQKAQIVLQKVQKDKIVQKVQRVQKEVIPQVQKEGR